MDIRKHALAWRWTDHRYAILPNSILNEMHPISVIDDAKEEFNRAMSYR